MGCNASTHAGGMLIHGGISFPDENDDLHRDDSRDDTPPKARSADTNHKRRRVHLGPREKHTSSASPSWGPLCPSVCQASLENTIPIPDAETLRSLPSVLSNTETSMRPACTGDGCTVDADNKPYNDFDGADSSDEIKAFSSRRWLALPEHKFDMDTLHPSLSPFLGSMYWTAAASPVPGSPSKGLRKGCAQNCNQVDFPSLMTPSTAASSPCPRFSMEDDSHEKIYSPLMDKRAQKLLLSLVPTNSSEWSAGSISDQGILNSSPKRKGDTSREILDYSTLSALDDINTSKTSNGERSSCPQTPRRLFDEGTDDGHMNSPLTPKRNYDSSRKSHGPAQHKQNRNDCNSYNYHSPHSTPCGIHSSTKHNEKIITDCASPSVATFVGTWGHRRERHVSTLPSQIPGKPIRLRITETDMGGCPSNNQGDCFSYDPYFSSGKYLITTTDGRPYGNGLSMKMGSQLMTLIDAQGSVLAVIKSRYTWTPSHVIYAPKPRFSGQIPSGHRLSLNGEMLVMDGGNDNFGDLSGAPSQLLYPWALVQKEGRSMGDDATIHMVDEGSLGNSSGLFNNVPSFRGKHQFDFELHTHSVVTRTALHEDKDSDNSVEEIPCSVIVRDPSNMDAVDITIAPGIDPLLMICYLASHSKMDVECII